LQLQSVKAFSQTDTLRLKLVHSLSSYIKDHYVSSELGKQMCDSINWKINNGMYDTALNPDEFAFELTTDLRRISGDLHITVTPLIRLQKGSTCW